MQQGYDEGCSETGQCPINLVVQRVSRSLIFEMAFWDSVRWSYVRLTDRSGVSELLNVIEMGTRFHLKGLCNLATRFLGGTRPAAPRRLPADAPARSSDLARRYS